MMKKLLAMLCALPIVAWGQSAPNWPSGYQPRATEWNAQWASKQDYGSAAVFASLSVSGTVSGVGFTNLFASPPPLGNVAANTVKATSLTTTGASSFTGAATFGVGSAGSGTGLTALNKISGTRIDLIPGTTTFDGGGLVNTTIGINTNLTGSTAATGIHGWNAIVINSDTLTQTTGSAIVADLGMVHNFGGAGFKGSRLGYFSVLTQTGAVTGTPGVFENIITGAQLSVTFTNSFGGSGVTPGTAAGFGSALNPFMAFTSGATNLGGGSGMEIDVLTGTGTSMMDAVGALVFRYPGSTVQAARDDVGVVIASPTQTASQGWKVGLQFGSSGGGFAVDPVGTLIGAMAGTGTLLSAKGIAWSGVTFSTSAIETPGFTVNGSGNVTALTYKVGSNQVVGARATGWTAMTGTPNIVAVYDTASVTLAQLAGRVMSLQAALTTHGLIGP